MNILVMSMKTSHVKISVLHKRSQNMMKQSGNKKKSKKNKTHVPVKTMTTEEINAKSSESDALFHITTGPLFCLFLWK